VHTSAGAHNHVADSVDIRAVQLLALEENKSTFSVPFPISFYRLLCNVAGLQFQVRLSLFQRFTLVPQLGNVRLEKFWADCGERAKRRRATL
jgi:hypothetical protein